LRTLTSSRVPPREAGACLHRGRATGRPFFILAWEKPPAPRLCPSEQGGWSAGIGSHRMESQRVTRCDRELTARPKSGKGESILWSLLGSIETSEGTACLIDHPRREWTRDHAKRTLGQRAWPVSTERN
jgi:hypothetical protein